MKPKESLAENRIDILNKAEYVLDIPYYKRPYIHLILKNNNEISALMIIHVSRYHLSNEATLSFENEKSTKPIRVDLDSIKELIVC